MLADDHEEFLAVEVRLLEPEFEVLRTVGNGRAVLEEDARLAPDVIVLDIAMPLLGGIETARHLRAAGSRAKTRSKIASTLRSCASRLNDSSITSRGSTRDTSGSASMSARKSRCS